MGRCSEKQIVALNVVSLTAVGAVEVRPPRQRWESDPHTGLDAVGARLSVANRAGLILRAAR
jgi:hypothetical protein